MKDDRDSEEEGRLARNVFRTDSDSSEDDESGNNSQKRLHVDGQSVNNTILRKVMHVQLEEQIVGGSIAHRLWPAAEYLANFLLNFVSNQSENEPSTETLRKAFELNPLSFIELGAGIGLTGLELASQIPCTVLLTDLQQALPLLNKNCALNADGFVMGGNAVKVQELAWGNLEHAQTALAWYQNIPHPRSPLILLGSDVVYWEELHEPLERTLSHLLSSAPEGSLCILAGMRRWKRDNSFYQSLGKRTRTASHELKCTRIQETITRVDGERHILRIFVVHWVQRQQGGSRKAIKLH